jgi:co-chaperonin GroES (HSP10)
MLLAEKAKVEDSVGGVYIPETAIDSWRMEATIVEVSPKLDSMLDDYAAGDRVVYHGGSHVFPLRIDEKDYIIFHKKFVACKVIEND